MSGLKPSRGPAVVDRIVEDIRDLHRRGKLGPQTTTKHLTSMLRKRGDKPFASEVRAACEVLQASGFGSLERISEPGFSGRPTDAFCIGATKPLPTFLPEMGKDVADRLQAVQRRFAEEFGPLFDNNAAMQRALHRKLILRGLAELEKEHAQRKG